MPGKRPLKQARRTKPAASARRATRPSSLLDTRIIYCDDCLDQLAKLPDGCVDLIYIDTPFNSNRSYEVFWGEIKEKRAFEDRHAWKSRLTGVRLSRKMRRYGARPATEFCSQELRGP